MAAAVMAAAKSGAAVMAAAVIAAAESGAAVMAANVIATAEARLAVTKSVTFWGDGLADIALFSASVSAIGAATGTSSADSAIVEIDTNNNIKKNLTLFMDI